MIPVARAREEAFQLLADDLVKEGLLRLMPLVLGHEVPDRDRECGGETSKSLGRVRSNRPSSDLGERLEEKRHPDRPRPRWTAGFPPAS